MNAEVGATALRRMVAVAHECTITGAPMNLLHLVTWIRRHTDVEVHVVVMKDGPLRYRFEKVCDVTVLDRAAVAAALGVAQQGLVRLGSRRAWRPVAAARLIPQLRHLKGYDLAYLNSVTSVGVLPFLPAVPVAVNHVHELHVALRTWRPSSDYDLFATAPDRWIAASGAVRDMLVDEVGLDDERVLLHHEFIDATPFAEAQVPLREVERRRREYRHPDGTVRIPTDAAVVMGAGTVDWRKGPDLFVQLATEVRRRTREPVHFVWVGGDLDGPDMERLRSDVERSGAHHVHFVGTKPDPLAWYAMADVFALTSREDPFPLVCLEHAAMAHPIVTYRNGGMVELLEAAGPSAARGVVDHLDVATMADRVVEYLGSGPLRDRAGRELRRRVLDHHDVEVAAPRLFADLERLVRERPPPTPTGNLDVQVQFGRRGRVG